MQLLTRALHLCQRPAFREVGINLGALVLERTGRLAVLMAVTAALSRYLGVETFGLYSALFSLATLLALLSDLGLGRVVVRDLVQGDLSPGSLLGTAATLRIGSSFFLGGLTLLLVVLLHGVGEPAPLLLSIGFVLGYWLRNADVVDLGFQAASKAALPAMARLVGLVLGVGLYLVFIQQRLSYPWFGVAFALEGLFMAVALVWTWHRLGPSGYRGWTFDRHVAHRILREGWPIFAAFLCVQIYFRTDVILLERMIGPGEAGLYAVSSRIFEILTGVLHLVSIALFPHFTRWFRQDPTLFHRRFLQLKWTLAGLGLVVVLVVGSVRLPLIHALYGEAYLPSASILSWHLIAVWILYLTLFRALYLILIRRQTLVLWSNLAGAVLNIVLNLVLIPILGGVGAGIATVITLFVALVLSNLCFAETRWLVLGGHPPASVHAR